MQKNRKNANALVILAVVCGFYYLGVFRPFTGGSEPEQAVVPSVPSEEREIARQYEELTGEPYESEEQLRSRLNAEIRWLEHFERKLAEALAEGDREAANAARRRMDEQGVLIRAAQRRLDILLLLRNGFVGADLDYRPVDARPTEPPPGEQ